jgi:glycine/sarcosine N-methyltransferase
MGSRILRGMKALTSEEFYDSLASEYDLMTDFPTRFERERPSFQALVERHGVRSALDAGCGTGFHALLLAQLGVRVTAVDTSKAMLARARQHARELGLRIETVRAGFAHLQKKIHKRFDSVFCMGNTLAHLLSPEDLRLALANFAALLRPGGIFFAQNLNYDRILRERGQIQNVKESHGKKFTRSYEYDGDLITFIIQTTEDIPGAAQSRSSSTRLRPVLADELVAGLEAAGWRSVQTFGGIAMGPFDRERSMDLVVLARRPEMLQAASSTSRKSRSSFSAV